MVAGPAGAALTCVNPGALGRLEWRAMETWSGRAGFILAAIGSAVGLGSIWKFPYEVGANGGAAFVLFYLLGLALAVAPLMFAEFAIGRRGGGDAAASIAALARAHGAGRGWAWAGVLGAVTSALILSFYSVIGGWTLAYALEPGRSYEALLASPGRMAACHALFLALAAGIVARGVARGIELACKVLMPLLVVLMLALAAYSAAYGDLRATLGFLFRLEPAAFTARAALEALGLGFFSIGVGFGVMITYAAYAGRTIDLRQAALWSIGADTAISFLAGFAVFPVVFANGLDPASGPGLMFVTLPAAFSRMPFGAVAASAFFVLLFVAALASAVSMLEIASALLARRLRWPRPRAAAAVAAACFAAGLATVLSFNRWSHWQPTPFDALDYATSNVLLPIGGLAIALFAGWVLPRRVLAEEMGLKPHSAALLGGLLRWATPALIAAAALAPLWLG
jgi:NSS family neurotransmitter:Na+ symporter